MQACEEADVARISTARDRGPKEGMYGIGAVVHFLERKQFLYELIEHQNTFAAVDQARATQTAFERMAKTMLLHDGGGDHRHAVKHRTRSTGSATLSWPISAMRAGGFSEKRKFLSNQT
jgi:hypothetical protein